MSYEGIRERLKGTAFVTAAAFSEDGFDILPQKIAENTQSILDAGGEVFVPCGNTGEYHSLSDEERVQIVETSVNTVGDEGVVLGGAAGSVKTAKKLLSAYEKAGADGALIMPPDHTFIHQRGLVEYYSQLAEYTDLGLVLYKRGPELSLSTISELSTRDNVVGIKYADNDINEFSKMVNEVTGDVSFITGIAERYAPAFAFEGANGFTTGIGAFVPKASLALMEALRNGEWERAKHIRNVMRPFEEIREDTGSHNSLSAANNVPAVKYGMELAGLYGGPVRPPLIELSEEDKKRAEKCFEKMKNLEKELVSS